MKKCWNCGKEKPLECFSKNRVKHDGLSAHCKDCHKVMRKEHYEKNKPKILLQVYKKKVEYCAWLDSLKTGQCVDCGRSFPSYCMDFDHIQDKEFSVSLARTWRWARETVLKEIAKCELVCAVCHRIRTHNRLHH